MKLNDLIKIEIEQKAEKLLDIAEDLSKERTAYYVKADINWIKLVCDTDGEPAKPYIEFYRSLLPDKYRSYE